MTFTYRIINEHDVIDGLKTRREALGLSQETVELDVMLAHGHLGKIEHGDLSWGKRVIRMSQTLGWLLERLGLHLILMDAEHAERMMGPHIHHRQRTHRSKETKEVYPNHQELRIRMTQRPQVRSTTCAAFLPELTRSGSQLDPLLQWSQRPRKRDMTGT